MEKRYLFTPGPTPVPPAVLAAGAEPIVHHRGADFREIYASVLGRLKDVYRTEADVLLFTASGSGAMESAPANLCAPGDRVTVEVSPYDLEKGRLIFRHKSERAGASHPPPQRHQFRRR